MAKDIKKKRREALRNRKNTLFKKAYELDSIPPQGPSIDGPHVHKADTCAKLASASNHVNPATSAPNVIVSKCYPLIRNIPYRILESNPYVMEVCIL